MSLTVITRLLLLAVFLSLELASLVYAGDPHPAERDTPQGERNYAVARVIQDYKNPYSFAQLEPAPFTIPKGYVATAFNYRWVDPKTDLKNEKLTTTTIYSITEQRYLTEVKNNPDFILKAGEYKAVCGGMAGATGVLGYTLIREDLVKKIDEVVKTKPPKTPGGKPTPPSDTTTNDVKPDPHGKSVLIRFEAAATREGDGSSASSEGTINAKIAIKGTMITFDFDPRTLSNAGANVPKDTVQRWEGKLSGSGEHISVKGAVTGSASWQHASGRGSYKSQGTFQGEMQGTTLKGTCNVSSFYESSDPNIQRYTLKTTMEWSIDGFDQVLSGR